MLKNLSTGAGFLFKGWQMMWHPQIRVYVWIPLLLNLILISIGFWFALDLLESTMNSWKNSDSFWAELVQTMDWLIYPLLVISIFLTVLYAFTLFANWIAAPFNGLLSERIEELLTGAQPQQTFVEFIKNIPRMLMRELQKMLYYLPRALFLLALFFLGITTPIAPFLWFFFSAWFLSLQFIDYPMDNNQISFKQMHQLMREKRWHNLGFGMSCTLIMIIPILNILLMPLAVSGATIMWVNLYKSPVTQGHGL